MVSVKRYKTLSIHNFPWVPLGNAKKSITQYIMKTFCENTRYQVQPRINI